MLAKPMMLVVALAAPVAAQAQDLCSDLNRIAAAATEATAFGTLSAGPGPLFQGTLVPEGAEKCSVFRASPRTEALTGHSYHCMSGAVPQAMLAKGLVRLNAGVGQCLGVTGTPPRLGNRRGENQTDYILDRAPHRIIVSVFTYGADKPEGGSLQLMVIRKPPTP